MISDLARVAFGMPAVALAVPAIPLFTRHRRAAALVAAIGAIAMAWPLLWSWRGCAIVALAVLGSRAVLGSCREIDAASRPLPWPAPAAVVMAIAVAALAGLDAATDAFSDVMADNALWLVVAAGLFAIPIGGAVVPWLLRPYQDQLGPRDDALVSAGRVIGWMERALLFGLLAAGQPEAAGLALAAKSVARFPQLQKEDEPFAEYVLVGTLLSVTIAGACAVATRAALGLPLL